MRYLASVAAALAAGPAAAHVAHGPHVHGDHVGALAVGVALIVATGGVALAQARRR